jgi:membrane protein
MSAAAATAAQAKREAGRINYKALAKETLQDIKRDDVPGLAAEIAYHAIFAIPPLIIFMVTVAALVNQTTGVPVAERLYEFINRSAPGETRQLLNTLVDKAIQQTDGGVASFGVVGAALLALWSGSNGVAALIKAFNRAYDVEETRGWFKKKAIAIGLTLLLAVMANAAFVMLVFGGKLGKWVAGKANLGDTFTLIWSIAYWPLAVIFVMFVLAILYYLGPNVEQSFRWISPGSVVATVVWILIAVGFRLYLTFSDPGSAYGAMGSIVVLMFFLYLSGIAFVLGAEVNAIIGRRYDPEVIEDLARNPEKIESVEDRARAERHAEELDRRTGDKESGRTRRSPFPVGRKSREPAPAMAITRQEPGRGSRLLAALGGLLVAIALTLVRRRTARG